MQSIKEAMLQGSGKVKIRGWVYRERKQKNMLFFVIRDSTGIIQCVLKKDQLPEDEWDKAQKILIESSAILEGTITKEPRAPTGYEIIAESFQVVSYADIFPINKDQSPELLLDNRHLWIRSRKLTAVFKIRSTVFWAIHEFFRKKEFHETHAPLFTPSACEGGATLFEVKYFSDKVYLTQSWQLYAEALIYSLEKIYCIAPCFRAEKSRTSRHLAEFWMAEMEAAWMDLKDVMGIAEDLIVYIVEKVLKENREELAILERDVSKLEKIKKPFHRITYTEALEILKKEMDVEWGKDLRTIEEEKIMEKFDRPVMVTHYPKKIMAFYKPSDPENREVALCFDMLAPEGYGEIVGGSQRDDNVEAMKKKLEEDGEDLNNYQWYFETRKFGSVPHAGFGMGVERIIAWICGLDNIRDAIPFPRTMVRRHP